MDLKEKLLHKTVFEFKILVIVFTIAVILALIFIHSAIWLTVTVLLSFSGCLLLLALILKRRNKILKKDFEEKKLLKNKADIK